MSPLWCRRGEDHPAASGDDDIPCPAAPLYALLCTDGWTLLSVGWKLSAPVLGWALHGNMGEESPNTALGWKPWDCWHWIRKAPRAFSMPQTCSLRRKIIIPSELAGIKHPLPLCHLMGACFCGGQVQPLGGGGGGGLGAAGWGRAVPLFWGTAAELKDSNFSLGFLLSSKKEQVKVKLQLT